LPQGLNKFIPQSSFHLAKLMIGKLVTKFPAVDEPEGLLRYSQQLAIGPCPDSAKSIQNSEHLSSFIL
jgi:hypothetical protein